MDRSVNALFLYQVYAARDFESTPEQPKYRMIADFLYLEDAEAYVEYLKKNPHDGLYKFYIRDCGK
jgi:hypothetical protein